MSRMEELVTELENVVAEMEEENNARCSDLSEADKEILDISHFIEFSNLDAAWGDKAYRDLRDTLQKRRAIKNDMKLLAELKAKLPGLNNFKEIHSSIEMNVKTQSYLPRVRKDLFEANDPLSLGSLAAYSDERIVAKTSSKCLEFNNIKEAVTYLLEGCVIVTEKTPKLVAKKILKACLTNSRYNAYKWSFVK